MTRFRYTVLPVLLLMLCGVPAFAQNVGPSGGTGAPTDATFITQTADGTLSAEQALSSLSTGCVSVTTTTGVLASRTITGTASEVTVTNGDCTAAPTISLPAAIDLGGKTSFEIPNAAAPTTNVFGQLAGDNNAWAASRGAPQFFDGTANTYLLGTLASDIPGNGECPKWNTGGTITWETCSGGTVTVVGAGALTSTALVTGGGTTTVQTPAATATMDASGNISTPGTITTGAGGSAAGAIELGQGTAPSAGTTSVKLYAPASVTSYIMNLPGASATGFLLGTDSTNVNTMSFVGFSGTGSVARVTSPSFTTPDIGAAVATTASANDNDTSVATTAYVQTELTAYASDTVTFTNKTLDAEGTGNDITIPFYWDADLVGISGGTAGHVWNDDPLSTACTPLAVTGTNRSTGVCTFPDSDGEFGRQITRYLPDGFTGSFDAEIWWKTTGTGNARFSVQTKCYADDEADDAAMNTASLVTAAAGTSARPNKQTMTGITTTGCAAGELMRIRFSRNRTEASDTLNAALDVEKVVFKGRVTN